MSDCAAKGRFNRKLNPDLVRAIRDRHSHGETMRGIARAIGITHRTVGQVVRRELWAGVDA